MTQHESDPTRVATPRGRTILSPRVLAGGLVVGLLGALLALSAVVSGGSAPAQAASVTPELGQAHPGHQRLAGFFGRGRGGHGHGRHGGRGMPRDPEEVREHAAFAAEWVLRWVDASDEQTADVQSVIGAAIEDLFALHEGHDELRDAVTAALSQPEIDRAELEALRVGQMDKLDLASQKLVEAVADIAVILTPEQRAELMELGERFHH